MITIDPSHVTTKELHGKLLGAVGPRPIAFASTINADGHANLAPFSFFNVFSANPPILIFSPARRVRDTTTKHTLENVKVSKEVVINIVNYSIVQQMSLASTEYPEGVDEFVKSGLSKIPSEKVNPYRVKESPVQLECNVNDIIALGEEGGAGNLIICEVVLIHINQDILDSAGNIDQFKIDQVARLGGNWYSRANKGLFEVPKPLSTLGIGVDALPDSIRNSKILSGNDLGKLGNIEMIPSDTEISEFVNKNPDIMDKIQGANSIEIHKFAQSYLDKNEIRTAWNILAATL